MVLFSALNRCRYTIFRSPSLDNFVFKLCYRWTVLLLVVFSFVVTCRLALGDSFICASNQNVPTAYMNVKCYADLTYTLPAELITQKGVIEPPAETFRRYHLYYSWVNLLFLVHAFNFYLPHLLWKSFESGYIYRLTAGVQRYFDKEEERGLELGYLAKYVLITEGKHKVYTSLYILFEVCNFSISIAQTLWLVHFFDVTGVPDILPLPLDSWSDFRQFYFPSGGICELRMLGASGTTMRVSTLCEMPLNLLHMKMFLFLHAWYIFITILTGVVLIYRIILLVPSFRVFSTRISTNLAELSVLKSLSNRMSYSDWFFLSMMRKTMTDVDFAQMLNKIVIISQGKDVHKAVDKSSVYEEPLKDFQCSDDTSPL